MKPKIVVRHFAEAFFYAVKKLGHEEWMGEKLLCLKEMIEEYAEFQRILSHPLMPFHEKEQAIRDLLPSFLSRKKEDLFISIAQEYQRLLNQAKDIESVEVTVAVPLSPALESEVRKRLIRLIGKEVRMEVKIDPDILGGLVFCYGDRVVDASVKKKLELFGSYLKTL